MSDFGEPWECQWSPEAGSYMVWASGKCECDESPEDCDCDAVVCFCETKEECERIVAAANACAGLNPEAIPELIEAVRRLPLEYMSEGAARDTLAALAKLEGDDE